MIGLAVGPFLWAPLAQRVGRSSCIFWGLLGALVCGVWSAVLTHPDDYNDFVVSRFFGAFFGSVASAIGAGTIIDLFFLHQRGKAFTCYTLMILFGTFFGPTISGFIVARAPWPVQFWWTVGVEGFIAILVFFFLEETTFPRDGKHSPFTPPSSYVSNRIATFFPGHKILPRTTRRMHPLSSFMIAICPVTIITGLFLFIAFAWAVSTSTLLAIFLQSPLEAGGYAFTPTQNATFTFSQWVSAIAGVCYGYFLNDRIPLWICERRGGRWKPEYRLYTLFLPAGVILPIGLGLFGASLQYHLHFMVLALGTFLIFFAETALVPIAINYVVESFEGHAPEATTALNFYRLALGIVIPFFIDPWEAAVSVGWVFGMQAFFTVLACGLVAVLVWKGPAIRQYSMARYQSSEDGVKLRKT